MIISAKYAVCLGTCICFYSLLHDSGWVLWFHVERPCVCPPTVYYMSIVSFPDDNAVNINGFSLNLVCALILWKSGLGLFSGKFLQFLTELSAHHTSTFWFPHNNVNKYQWIFTKLGICIYIVEICFEIANGQISSILD